MPFLAQTPSPGELGGWLICLASLLVIIQVGVGLLRYWKGKPPPEQLEFAGEQLGRRITSLESGIEHLRDENDDRRRAMDEKLDQVKDSMNESLGGVGREISALQANSELVNARLVQMDTKIDRLIERKH